jgi:hypothetical protein
VPLGRGTMGLQPTHANGTDVAAGLLGAHRVCVWKVLNPDEARSRHSHRFARTAGHFSFHGVAVGFAHKVEGAQHEPSKVAQDAGATTSTAESRSPPVSGRSPSAGALGVRPPRNRTGRK